MLGVSLGRSRGALTRLVRESCSQTQMYAVGHAHGGLLCKSPTVMGASPTAHAKFASSSVVFKHTESGRDSGWKEAAQWTLPGALALVGAAFSVAASSADMSAAAPGQEHPKSRWLLSGDIPQKLRTELDELKKEAQMLAKESNHAGAIGTCSPQSAPL